MSTFTTPRIHMGLPVSDLEEAIAFYSRLLGVDPSKRRERYARFEPGEPSVNLALTLQPQAVKGTGQHFGIQFSSVEALQAARKRLTDAGLVTAPEATEECCYAVQVKTWVTDPDGNAWELFHTINDDAQKLTDGTCCAPLREEATSCC